MSLTVGYETAMHFAGVAIDGPFQLYNALRRIQAGFRPGVDFQYFHGLGVPYAHYWLYRLFGEGLSGSELARELFATTLYPVEFLFVFRALSKSWSKAFALSAAAMASSYLLHLSAMLFALNGMLSLRSALPTMLPIILLLIPARRWRTLTGGALLGLAMFVSTEQGLAVAIAYVVVSALALIRTAGRREQMVEIALTLALAITTLVVTLLLVGGVAGMRGALRYNFKLVPMDQYWFFGAPPNEFIPSWGGAARMLARAPLIAMAMLLDASAAIWYCSRVWRRSADASTRRDLALAMLSVYGLISCASLLGAFAMAYVQPCWRILLIIGFAEGSRLCEQLEARSSHKAWLGVPRLVAVGAFGLCAYAAATIRLVPTALSTSLPHILRDHVAGGQRFSMAGIWPETLRDAQVAIEAHRSPDGRAPMLWSTYAGWIEARNGIFHPAIDYIIHALGPDNRAAYVEAFRRLKPALVQTVRPTYVVYERWLENNDWPVYDELLDEYQVYSMTPWSVMWERRQAPAPRPQLLGSLAVPEGTTSVQLPTAPGEGLPAATLFEVEIDYETRNPLKGLPFIGASPRFLVGISGALTSLPVSLNPFASRTRFPLIVTPGQTPTLHFQTFSLLPGASWKPLAVRLFVRPLDAGPSRWMTDMLKALGESK